MTKFQPPLHEHAVDNWPGCGEYERDLPEGSGDDNFVEGRGVSYDRRRLHATCRHSLKDSGTSCVASLAVFRAQCSLFSLGYALTFKMFGVR